MQLICGQHGEVCRFSIRLEVLGKEKIELTAHADYTAISNTAELLRVRSLLPNWASGAEWTNFASSLVSMRA